MAHTSPGQPVQSLTRALRLLEAVADADGRATSGIGVVDLAASTDLSPATAHRLLATLGDQGYVAQDPGSRRYHLGPSVFALAATADSLLATLRDQATPAMEALRDQFRETVNLSLLDRDHIIYVHQVETDRSVRAFNRIGNRVLAHASAAGKALLAFESDSVLDALGAHTEMEALTPSTITAPQDLVDHLQDVRRRGYALDLGEQDSEVICVAAPIGSATWRPAAAISISGPANRMRDLDLDAMGAALMASANGLLTA